MTKLEQPIKKKKKFCRIVRKILPVDRAFSLVVRAERGWECEWCHKQYDPFWKLVNIDKWAVRSPSHNSKNLGISHYWGCGRWATRLDRDNVDVLCTFPCHRHLGHGDGRQLYYEWKLNALGKAKYDIMQIQAQNTGYGKGVKSNQEMFLIWYLQDLKHKFAYQIDWFFKEYKLEDWIIKAVEIDLKDQIKELGDTNNNPSLL